MEEKRLFSRRKARGVCLQVERYKILSVAEIVVNELLKQQNRSTRTKLEKISRFLYFDVFQQENGGGGRYDSN